MLVQAPLALNYMMMLQEHILDLIKEALKLAQIKQQDIDCIAYTKVCFGPSMHCSDAMWCFQLAFVISLPKACQRPY